MVFRFKIFLHGASKEIQMQPLRCSTSIRIRTLLAAVWGMLCAAIAAAPWFASHSYHNVASALYLLFSGICHQIPERSFALFGYPLPVCHRCAGIYAGLFLGCFVVLSGIHRHTGARRYLVLGSITALAMDALAPVAGLWNNSAFSRFSTGLLFGIVTSLLVVRGLEEFAQEFSWRRLVTRPAQLKGDLL
jgi:uncharacterized membrane protein